MQGIGYLIWNIAEYSDDLPCIRDDSIELNYRQFAARVDAVAAQLAARGVGSGDLVAVALSNRVELPIILMAAWRIGAAATPIDPGIPASEAEYRIRDSGAVLVVDEGPGAPSCGRPVIHVDDLATELAPGWTAGPDPEPEQLALVSYPPGSTGRPEGVRSTHADLQYTADSLRTHLRLIPPDHCLQSLPLCDVDPITVSLLAPLLAGAQLSITGGFAPTRFFDEVARLRPTYLSAVPSTYALLAAQPVDAAEDLSSLRFGLCAAGPLPEELLARVERRFAMAIIDSHGLTEATCASAGNPLDAPRRLGAAGPDRPRGDDLCPREVESAPDAVSGHTLGSSAGGPAR
ncbi:class I adenylate-forming enzyme family protein [Nocardia higoensis]|uniref:class I adenylate-forming enzyme family protein n=1 Tax=Nocardia higoensis TaxID=228599 RepID=UPI0002DD4DB4|nr:AMP-binding protein [Nocardia higoensis]